MLGLLTRHWLPILSTVLISCFLITVATRSIPVEAAQIEGTNQSRAYQTDVAKHLLEIRTQQVAVAKAELDMLGATQQVAEQKVNQMNANLAAERISTENTESLYEKKVISAQEKQHQVAKLSSAEASLMIAKAESDRAAKSISLAKARIVLLEMRMKLAETEFKHKERELQSK